MLGVVDIRNCCHHLKIIEEGVAETVEAQRRNIQRAMVPGDISGPVNRSFHCL